jgi:hypothetical protein
LEEPPDLMLAQLHILRVCMAIKDGRLTIDAALNEGRKLLNLNQLECRQDVG